MTDTAAPLLPSYRSGTSDRPLLGELIGQVLRRTAATYPEREALVDVPSGRRWTWQQLDHDVDRLATGLLGLGLAAGQRVAVWATNCPEWVLLQYATARVGLVLVTVNPAYRVHELAFVLAQSGAALLVSAERHRSSDYRAMVAQVAAPATVFLGSSQWSALLVDPDAAALDARAATLSFDDPINIQYTSGTTGSPKGATLSHHSIVNNGFFVGELCGYDETDRVCVPVPFYHCFGMVMGNLGALTHGACVVIPAPSFDPAATLAAVESERCTSLYGVPTMFIAELGLPDVGAYDLRSLRTGIMAGSPCPAEVMERVVGELGMTDVTICYGMTETSPVSTQTRADDDLRRRVTTVGRVHPHLEVKVVDPGTGLVVPEGTTGELCTRGYSVMLGYWQEPERTAEAVDGTGWMHTGDLAVMDADGYLQVVGRIKDLVIRGGENIYPREVEDFLHRHPDVEDVQVVGVPDPRYGEELLAAVRLRPGSDLTEEGLREHCRGAIAHYKVPRHVRFVTDFPMTVTGKIKKFEIRDQWVSER